MGANKSKVTGFGDQLFKNPRKQVEKLSTLKVADHIVFQRKLYEHHGIVVAVDKDEGTFDVIEYDGNKSKSLAQVHRKTHSFSEEPEGTLYIVQYKKGECLPVAKVIKYAEKWLNTRDYNILLNNCECMAQACKTGQAKTEQIRHLFKFVAKEAGPPVAKGAMVGAARVASIVGEKAMLTGAAKLGTGITKLGAPMVAFGGVVEAGLAANDIHHIVRKNREGKINNRRRDAMIGTRVATAGGDIGGGVGGMIVGGLVGGPIGVVVGGLVGGLGGRFVAWVTSKGVITAIEKNTNHFGDEEKDEDENLIQEDADTDRENEDTDKEDSDAEWEDAIMDWEEVNIDQEEKDSVWEDPTLDQQENAYS